MDRFEKLVSDYFDGILAEAGADELARLLEQDDARRALFIEMYKADAIMKSDVRDLAGERFADRVLAEIERDGAQFAESVMSDVAASRAAPEEETASLRTFSSRRTARRRRSGPLAPHRRRPAGHAGAWAAAAAAAAAVLLVLGLVALSANRGATSSSTPPETAEKSHAGKTTAPLAPPPGKETFQL